MTDRLTSIVAFRSGRQTTGRRSDRWTWNHQHQVGGSQERGVEAARGGRV